MTRAYRIVAKIKNNRLWRSIEETFPTLKSQSAMSKKLRISQICLGELLNMKYWPYNVKRQRWTPTALYLSKRLGESPEYLFDPELYGKPPLVTQVSIETDRLALPDALRLMLPPEPSTSPEDALSQDDRVRLITEALTLMTEREAAVLSLRFGLKDGDEHTYKEIGEKLGISNTRAQQIERTAIHKLTHRHRSTLKKLRELIQ